MSSPRLRLLLVLQYPGNLRYFDSVIDELSRRGHTVLIAFDRLQKQREGLIGLDDTDDRVKRVDAIPDRGDPYSVVARELRTTVDYLRYKHPDFRQSPYLRGRMLEALTGPLRLLGWLPSLPPWLLDKLISSLLYLERRVPSAAAIRSAIDNHDVDVVLVSLLTKAATFEILIFYFVQIGL